MNDIINRQFNIEKIILRLAGHIDDKLEVKVLIKNHIYQEANLRVDWQQLKDVGAVRTKGSFRRAERWMSNNKDFVLKLIDDQLHTFWDVIDEI
ncbi:MAG: hypothetical protein KBT36_09590 [Kurthia sp.]|nr:hypothetical protein [Candidatus Kurthia equi]